MDTLFNIAVCVFTTTVTILLKVQDKRITEIEKDNFRLIVAIEKLKQEARVIDYGRNLAESDLLIEKKKK